MLEARATAPLIWDVHSCPSRAPGNDLTVALERYRSAGFDSVTVNVADAYYGLEDAIGTIATFRRQLTKSRERYLLVNTFADLQAARGSERLAVSFDVEGVLSIGADLDLVDLYYDLGVRWMAFVYNRRNNAGYGCHDDVDGGLTPFGRRLVERMEHVGMIKCCSHTGYRTALEVFAASSKPSILSHSNPRRLVDHERNVPDDVLKACAATDGVIGINGVGLFLGAAEPSVADLFRHLDYVVNLVGVKHVGIGLDTVIGKPHGEEADFTIDTRPEYWPPEKGYYPRMPILGPEILSDLLAQMERAGYPRADIGGILGGNFARVAAACWR